MMKAAMLTFTAAAMLLAGGEEALKKEKTRFVGTWKVTKLASPKGDQDVAGATLMFNKDGTLEFRHGDETKKATFKLNPAAKPHEIDVTPDEDANKVFLGIYQIEKNMLKLCIDVGQNSQRPTEFTAPEGASRILLVLEKGK